VNGWSHSERGAKLGFPSGPSRHYLGVCIATATEISCPVRYIDITRFESALRSTETPSEQRRTPEKATCGLPDPLAVDAKTSPTHCHPSDLPNFYRLCVGSRQAAARRTKKSRLKPAPQQFPLGRGAAICARVKENPAREVSPPSPSLPSG